MDQRFRQRQKLALAKALISDIGNVEFGPEIDCTLPKGDAPVLEAWLRGGVKRSPSTWSSCDTRSGRQAP